MHIYGYKMKKFLVLLFSIVLPLAAAGQAQINTKKVKISDLTQKVTKVVLNGNPFYDSALKDEISSRWRVSPYEFCTLEDFEKLKSSDQYYFLMLTEGQFKKEKEPGIQFFTFVKGGSEASKGIEEMLEVVTVPFASAEDPSGRELIYLPALIDIIQDYAVQSMEKDLTSLGGLANYSSNLNKTRNMDIILAEEDLSKEVLETVEESCNSKGVTVTDADTADEYAGDGRTNTLVSYTVAPSDPVPGSFCYKMLIDTNTHQLYYFRKHRISKKVSSGFLPEDIKRIMAFRPKN